MTDFKTKMAELAAKYHISHQRDIDWHNFVYEVQQLKKDELNNVHDLKILPEYFRAVKSGEKTFEVRFNDRNFQKGDMLHLREWNGSEYTGESIYVEVTYILNKSDFCKDGYVIMAIRKMEQKEQKPAEWSEEDSKRYISIGTTLETSVVLSKEDYDANMAWLRELVNAKKYSGPRPSWKPSEQKYDGNMDKECIKLCDILNSITSIDTFESCCGHLKDRYSIWFFCNDIITISRLGRCVERNYSDGKWELLVDPTDTHPNGVFWLRSKVPFQSYDEMEKSVNELCNGIQHWFNTEFDSYFNSDSSHWKPSEEQMRALADALEDMPEHYKPKCTLESLERELKKLK